MKNDCDHQNSHDGIGHKSRKARGHNVRKRINLHALKGKNLNQDMPRQDSRQENPGGNSSEDSLTICIPQKMVGKIIGRGGHNLKKLQEQSGAKICITSKSRYGNATVTLTCSEDKQRRAEQVIKELIDTRQDVEQPSPPPNPLQNTQNSFIKHKRNPPAEEHPLDPENFDWTKSSKEHQHFQKERWAHLKPMVKVFYEELPEVANMSREDVDRIRREKNSIECRRVFKTEGQSTRIPNPVLTFHQAFHNYPEILEEIRKQGFQDPSPIQCQAWPILLGGQDMIGIAQTGTGKTLAFLLPALIHIDGQPTPRKDRVGPNVLIMAPTRELAQQISNEACKYEYRGIKAACLFGGGSRQEQIKQLSNGVQIVIATPGRMNDLIMSGVLQVEEVTYLVLDEADRMLDMGFEPQIRKTLLDVRQDRQTVMTSATWPPGVRRLAESYMKDPIQVHIGSLDLAATHSVHQTIHIVIDDEKTDYLRQFFKSMGENDKVIVFFGKKSRVDDLSSKLALTGIRCQRIHGGRDQSNREQALEDIKSGEVRILLATDLASRGIDIEDITHVFNYDFPRDIQEYVHRVGRTGRAGRTGKSISLVTRGDWAVVRELTKILEEASQEVPKELYQMADRYDGWKKRKENELSENGGSSSSFRGGRGRGGGGGYRGAGRGGGGGRGSRFNR